MKVHTNSYIAAGIRKKTGKTKITDKEVVA